MSLDRIRLRTLLIGVNSGLVVLAVVAVAFAAARLVERLADEQAQARVELAGRSALAAVERSGGDVSASAHLLAERPTVGRLLVAGDTAGLGSFLDRFRTTSRLSGCAVLLAGEPAAASGPPLPWADLLRSASASPGQPVLLRGPAGDLIFAASAPLVFHPGGAAVSALRLDAAFVRGISRQAGLPVAIVPAAQAKPAGAYVADLPLRDHAGLAVAVVEASLPEGPVVATRQRFERALFFAALLVGALASLSGLLISRRLAGPVQALTAAAARIGRGDFSTPILRAPGAELGTLAATMEETRRRLLRLTSEQRRRQAEGEAILTGIVEGVMSVDRDRRISYLNPQAARLLGVRPEQAIGRFCGDVLRPVGPDGVRPCEEHCPILHARFRGATRATERLRQPDGTQRVVVITSAPPVEDQQFLVISDETETEAARRLRDAVLANISHELKTPLAAQRASIELLRERLLEGSDTAVADMQSLLLALERGGLRLTQLIDNLLENVRLEAGQGSIRRRPVALDEVVEEAVEMTAPLLTQREQRLEVELPYPLPTVDGDAPRLTQVFVNLLANATKFAPAGSTVRIGGEVAEAVVCLWVEDEGPGMPGEGGPVGGSLFERFVRAPGRTEEPEQSGMGLGLWIVQSIVERHGGRVEARREDERTRIRVTLPVTPMEEPGEATP